MSFVISYKIKGISDTALRVVDRVVSSGGPTRDLSVVCVGEDSRREREERKRSDRDTETPSYERLFDKHR